MDKKRSTKRLLKIFAVAAITVVATLAFVHFSLRRPVGKGSAGPVVSQTAFRKIWSTRPVLFLGMGDSVTAGFGARKGRSYFDLLVKNPPGEFPELNGISLSALFPNFNATNLALSGSTSIQHLKLQFSKLPRQTGETLGIIVLTTGGNDIIHNYGRTAPSEGAMYGATFDEAKPWIANFEIRLEQILTNFQQLFPGGCHVFLANIYDPTDGIGDADKAGLPAWKDGGQILKAYNKIIERCAAKYSFVHLVNIHDEFLGHGIHCTQFWQTTYRRDDPHYWYHENLEDPNERGYDALRRLFLIEMAKVFSPVEQK